MSELHSIEAVQYEGACAGVLFGAHCMGFPGDTIPSSTQPMFPVTEGILEGTGQDDRLGNKITCKYLTITVNMGDLNAATPLDYPVVYGPQGWNEPEGSFVMSVIMHKTRYIHEGTISTPPLAGDYWDTTESGFKPNTWVKAKERNTKGTILFQKTLNYQVKNIPGSGGYTTNDSMVRVVRPKMWKFQIKLPPYVTTWDETALLPFENHIYICFRKTAVAQSTYGLTGVKCLTKLYFSP